MPHPNPHIPPHSDWGSSPAHNGSGCILAPPLINRSSSIWPRPPTRWRPPPGSTFGPSVQWQRRRAFYPPPHPPLATPLQATRVAFLPGAVAPPPHGPKPRPFPQSSIPLPPTPAAAALLSRLTFERDGVELALRLLPGRRFGGRGVLVHLDVGGRRGRLGGLGGRRLGLIGPGAAARTAFLLHGFAFFRPATAVTEQQSQGTTGKRGQARPAERREASPARGGPRELIPSLTRTPSRALDGRAVRQRSGMLGIFRSGFVGFSSPPLFAREVPSPFEDSRRHSRRSSPFPAFFLVSGFVRRKLWECILNGTGGI